MPKLGDISGSFKSLEGDIKGEKHEKESQSKGIY